MIEITQIKVRQAVIFIVGMFLLAVICGCTQTRTSEPSRTAVEQLLLSRAADLSIAKVDFSTLAGRKVFLEDRYLEAIDKLYVIGALREGVSKAGGKLQDARDSAEVIVEARSGALSIDSNKSLLGLPELPVPIPLAGTLVSPEVPFFRESKQYSIAKIAVLAYSADSRDYLFSSGPSIGESFHHYFSLLGWVQWNSSGLPEKQ